MSLLPGGTRRLSWRGYSMSDTGTLTSRTHSAADSGTDPLTYTYTYGDSAHPDAVTNLAASGAGAPDPVAYTYTTSGERATSTTSTGTDTTTWDVTGRAITQSTPSGDVAYWYGAQGLFASTSDTASTVVYAGATQLFTGDGTTTARRSYTLGGVMVGYRDSATGVSAAAGDVQGSASIQTDPALLSADAGWVKNTYNPYGTVRTTTGVKAWSGIDTWLDAPTPPGTTTMQLGARAYDPSLQQFTSPDPLMDPGRPGTFNPYTYAGGNPTTYTDPTGLWFWDDWTVESVAGAIGGAVTATAHAVAPWAPDWAVDFYADEARGVWNGLADAVKDTWEQVGPMVLCLGGGGARAAPLCSRSTTPPPRC